MLGRSAIEKTSLWTSGPPWTSSYLTFILEQHSTAKSAQSTFCFGPVGYLSKSKFFPNSWTFAVTLWFIEGHVMFQIRGQQNGSRHMNCHLQPPKRTCGHMLARADGKYWQTGVSPIRRRKGGVVACKGGHNR